MTLLNERFTYGLRNSKIFEIPNNKFTNLKSIAHPYPGFKYNRKSNIYKFFGRNMINSMPTITGRLNSFSYFISSTLPSIYLTLSSYAYDIVSPQFIKLMVQKQLDNL